MAHTYSFAALDLLDEKDHPVPALAVLKKMVESKGTVKGTAKDQGFIVLGGVLTKLVGINQEPPLEFSLRDGVGQWLAQFEILPSR